MLRSLTAVLLSAWLSVACATLVTGTHDDVEIETVPPGAMVEIQGKVIKTPDSVTLSRSLFGPARGLATLEGYRSKRFELPREFNLWVIGNIVTLGLGIWVDLFSGAFFTLPDEHQILLEKEEAQPSRLPEEGVTPASPSPGP